VLRQERGTQTTLAGNLARVGVFTARKNTQQGRLAAAVRADQSNARLRRDHQIGPAQDGAATERFV
jgi:hypothetical protein